MDHGQCLGQLRALGASEASIMLVRSFLHGREMSVTIDGVYCGTSKIIRGSPQGSVLGCLLYCVTTQSLTKPRPIIGCKPPPPTDVPVPPTIDPIFEDVPPLPLANSAPDIRFFPGSDSEDSEGVNFWDSSNESSRSETGSWIEVVDDDGVVTFKYVDDTTAFEYPTFLSRQSN